jgi:hypothetical protein
MRATLAAAVIGVIGWAFLLATAPPSGWLHVPLAVGVTLLVRWIALRDTPRTNEAAPGT